MSNNSKDVTSCKDVHFWGYIDLNLILDSQNMANTGHFSQIEYA